MVLTEMKQGEEGLVYKLAGGREMTRRLEALGLRTGKKVKKVSSLFERGPVVLELNGRLIAIGHGQARRIYVKMEAEADENIIDG